MEKQRAGTRVEEAIFGTRENDISRQEQNKTWSGAELREAERERETYLPAAMHCCDCITPT